MKQIDHDHPVTRGAKTMIGAGLLAGALLASGVAAAVLATSSSTSHRAVVGAAVAHPGMHYPNFACVAIGDLGICVGPPTSS